MMISIWNLHTFYILCVTYLVFSHHNAVQIWNEKWKKKTINSNMIKIRWKNQVFHECNSGTYVIRIWYSYAILFAYGWQLMSWCQSWGAQMVIEWKNAKIIHTIHELSTFLHNLFLVPKCYSSREKFPYNNK